MTKPPAVTPEERSLVKEAMVIPTMLDYIQSDITAVQRMNLKLDMIIVKSLQAVEQQMVTEHLNVRSELKQRGIKLLSVKASNGGIEGEFLCRGYRHRMELMWGTVRAEVLHKASRYTGVKLTGG